MKKPTEIINKIRKLLNLAADDSSAEGEIENALRFAQRLMDEHNLTRDDLTPDEIAAESERMTRTAVYGGTTTCAAWERALVRAVCSCIGTVSYYIAEPDYLRTPTGIVILPPDRTAGPKVRGRWQFFGLAEDVALAVALFNETRELIAAMSRLRWGGVYRGPGRSYCEGFASALEHKASRASRERTPATTAIIRRDAARNLQWLQETHHVRLRNRVRRPAGNHYGSAYQSGQSDGRAHCFTPGSRSAKLSPAPKALPSP